MAVVWDSGGFRMTSSVVGGRQPWKLRTASDNHGRQSWKLRMVSGSHGRWPWEVNESTKLLCVAAWLLTSRVSSSRIIRKKKKMASRHQNLQRKKR